ncbi:hypothetical protein H8356DRAFT_947008 [Neocallimastix lanati (nom. inval.)]|nr:hypothetical protein H8356DRAFT_947008 [Neocallimastix sp. JGI-2020a]
MDIIKYKNNVLILKDNQPPKEKIIYSNDYDVEPKIHILISAISCISGISFMFLFWYNRNHYLIKYRGFKSAFTIGCVNFANMSIIPLLFYNEWPCYTNFVVNSLGASVAMIL